LGCDGSFRVTSLPRPSAMWRNRQAVKGRGFARKGGVQKNIARITGWIEHRV
jgi:hypothetical protein